MKFYVAYMRIEECVSYNPYTYEFAIRTFLLYFGESICFQKSYLIFSSLVNLTFLNLECGCALSLSIALSVSVSLPLRISYKCMYRRCHDDILCVSMCVYSHAAVLMKFKCLHRTKKKFYNFVFALQRFDCTTQMKCSVFVLSYVRANMSVCVFVHHINKFNDFLIRLRWAYRITFFFAHAILSTASIKMRTLMEKVRVVVCM